MEFVLIRHTRCDVATGTCYGRLDVPLAESSVADIALTLAQIPPVGAIFASPSRRCRELAQALANRDVCDVRVLPELMELDFGEWEGRRWDDIPREQSDPWAEDPWRLAPPRGESESDLWTRVQRAFGQIAKAETPRIAIVSHGGPLRLLRCLLTNAPIDDRWRQSIEWGAVVRVECTSEFLLTALRESASRSSGP